MSLLAAGIYGGEVGAVGHRIVVAIDEGDVLVVAQGRGHDLVGLVLLPVGRLLVEQVLDPWLLVGERVEAVAAIVARLRAEAAPDLDHLARGLPGPPSSLTACSPAALPITTLSPPIHWWMRLVLTLRSSTMTGILASIAFSTTPVRPADSLGEIRITSTCWAIKFSTSATCFSVLSCPSVMMSSTSGCFSASASMSLLNWTRHGSTVVACEKPNRYFGSAAASEPPSGRQIHYTGGGHGQNHALEKLATFHGLPSRPSS